MSLVEQLRALLAEAPGNYINVAKVKAILDGHERAVGDCVGHPMIWDGPHLQCSCGADRGVTTVALPEDTPLNRAHMAGVHAYAEMLRTEQRTNLNVCVAAAVDAALDAYRIEVREEGRMNGEPLGDLPRDAVNPAAYLVAEYFPDGGGRWYLTSREHPGIVALAGELMLAGWDVRRVTPD